MARDKYRLGWSMPARLAKDCLGAGEPVALAVIGMGVIECEGEDDAVRVADAYADLAGDSDPVEAVRGFYEDQADEHDWMREPLEPFLTLFATPVSDDLQEKVALVAKVLRSQSVYWLEEKADADLLGRVMHEMMHQLHRRRGAPGGYSPAILNTLEMLMSSARQALRLNSFADLWAGSGQRAIGVATAIRMLGGDPEKVEWTLMDADPLARAICAVNLRAYDVGEDVVILDGSKYKQALLAASLQGKAPNMRLESYDIPPEVLSQIRDRR